MQWWSRMRPAISIWHFDFYRFDDPREWEMRSFVTFLPAPDSSWQNGPKRLQRLHLLRI